MKERETWLLVGLGNPGLRYAQTWHNCGYLALDLLAGKLGLCVNRARFKGAYGQGDYKGRRLVLLKPETYMNLSGESVRAAMDFFKIPAARVLVFYDDVDLPLGQSRLRAKGGAGTHNGMRSLLQHLGGGDFPRLRIGIGPAPENRDLADYVLERVPEPQRPALGEAMERGIAGALLWIEGREDEAMRAGNG